MKITVKNNYLVFPVNTLAADKRLIFKIGDKTVYALNIKIDYFNPDFYSYIDVSRFIGQTLSVSSDPRIKLDFRVSDKIDIDNLYSEPMRPQVHFTAKNGWINDPNGLIFADGIYHMFYQFNPAENKWGNMHWGHAASADLIHWTEEKTAMFPDDRGAMFSGCAAADEKNLLGKNSDGKKSYLLFYTCTSPFSQYLSYSTDDFKNIKMYSNKPVVPQITDGNRDPKVVFCQELSCYIMALYLEGETYCILKSDDLVNWNELQKIDIPGDNECPDIFPIESENGKRKWILTGAHGKYLVGNFDSGGFEPEQDVISHNFGDSAYAAQTFSNCPDGRIIQISWDKWNIPAGKFCGQMGFPAELSLDFFKGVYYLVSNPVKEIETIYNSFEFYKNIDVSLNNDFQINLSDKPYIFKIKDFGGSGKAEIVIFGRKIKFDFDNNEMKIGKNRAPIFLTNKNDDLTIIVDRLSFEIFSDGGKIYFTCLDENTVCDYNLPYFIVKSEKDNRIKSIEIHSLNSVWR